MSQFRTSEIRSDVTSGKIAECRCAATAVTEHTRMRHQSWKTASPRRDICSARASRSSSSFWVMGLGGQYWYDVRHDATTQPLRGYAAALLRSVLAISCARRWSFSTSWRLNSESASIMLIPTCCRTNSSASSLLVHAVDRTRYAASLSAVSSLSRCPPPAKLPCSSSVVGRCGYQEHSREWGGKRQQTKC